MINPHILRESPQDIKQALLHRGCDPTILDTLIALDTEWRDQQHALELLQAERNRAVPKGHAPSDDDRNVLRQLSEEINSLKHAVDTVKAKLNDASSHVPNLLQPDVPIGQSAEDNVVIRSEGTPKTWDTHPMSHDELARKYGLIDVDGATKISGARFAVFTGPGAKLERAIAAFMLDTHTTQFGYQEVSPPVIVNEKTLYGTGQLPKFKEDLYSLSSSTPPRLPTSDLWLSPTAEVQLTNLHANDILETLPKKYCAFTQCFRREAGNYGKDIKGIIRLHEFNKVELVQLVHPDKSDVALTDLLSHAEYILKALQIPYRVVALCSGDTGFASAKTYDIEVWFASQNQYREISSCSNFLDFQARRSKIRYRDAQKQVNHVHTINGSGLAVGRTLAAILEYYQDASGIRIPDVLVPYMGCEKIQ